MAADRALADLKAEIDSCVLQGMSPHLHCLSFSKSPFSHGTDILICVRICMRGHCAEHQATLGIPPAVACAGGGASPTADDDFAAAQGPAKLANWTWNEQRKKLLWEALIKAQQVGYQVESNVKFSWDSCIDTPCQCDMTNKSLAYRF